MLEEINRTESFLKKGEIILYPTDTVWGIGCDATDTESVKRIFEIKNREESKSLIILVDSIEMLQEYIDEIPDDALKILKENKKPTTIIYNNPKGLAKNTIASDNTVAIRIPDDEFCKQLIKKFGKPIVSTSANISGEPTAKSFSEISNAILNSVDYVVDLHREKITQKSSTILRIDNGSVIVIRE
ncbi:MULTISPECIES: L-threonylcarbamoyladenylate synthase [unclassified Tenacibaculum]|uniref:L-threonylcarbamoyladenylate synthase n=1 Tax=unclassified Tenacibaculum TaxID=2635139 RepID=UPI001F3CD2EE|nr:MULTISPECIES: L-threonylcarbamoyladenylate synthase [unclassified Tenacibaculum]MCF2875642.1 threonylcarbamoyl-AMP synthase [Tenacibaculum sp. Cn5-1]MCF2935718.1 threonylcarbamoyl-AMP synthase [Tenacibaculum sp. Cn5-34]MCG7512278.1 threonylcarbamoyl-AMP synthase [Tenacibaculum sp. Cn5-46]